MMKPNAQIIAALEQLEAARSAPENKKWLASRREIGRQIDPEAADVTWQFASVLDPYGLCESRNLLHSVGREYFARRLDREDWVSFDDLPPRTRERLWQRIRSGVFNTSDVELRMPGLDLNRMFFRPEGRQCARMEGRVAIRSGDHSDIPLIVKPTDPGSMIFQLVTREVPRFFVVGWMPASTAKRQYPRITVGSISAHFVAQDELRDVRELQTFLRQCA